MLSNQHGSVAAEHQAIPPFENRIPCDWLVVGLVLWMFLACCFPLYDTDLFWHLKTGEWILEHGTIPGYDLYTYTDDDKRWIDLHWGFQIVVAILYRMGGANLLVLTKAALLALTIGLGCYSGGTRLRSWQRVLCWFLPAMTISGRGIERPELVTLLCLVLWLSVLKRLELRPRWLWYLPALQVLWINCHALYILGLVVGACYLVDHLVRQFARGHWGLEVSPVGPKTHLLIRAGILCLVAAFANPYFEEGAIFPFTLLRKFTVDQELYSTIGEFQPPYRFFLRYGFANPYLNAEICLWIAAATSFGELALRGRVSVFRTLLFVAFSYLAWKASRNTSIFSLVAGFVMSENISELSSASPRSADKANSDQTDREWVARGVGIFLAGMIVVVVSGEWNRCGEKIRPFRLGEANAWYAHDAARFMGQPGFPKRVFAENYGIASVYTYHNGPEGKVFMDGRLEVCSRRVFERDKLIAQAMSSCNPVWIELVRDPHGELPAVMLDTRYSRKLIEGMLHTPQWRLVYADKAAAVFFHETIANALRLPSVSPEPLLHPPDF